MVLICFNQVFFWGRHAFVGVFLGVLWSFYRGVEGFWYNIHHQRTLLPTTTSSTVGCPGLGRGLLAAAADAARSGGESAAAPASNGLGHMALAESLVVQQGGVFFFKQKPQKEF